MIEEFINSSLFVLILALVFVGFACAAITLANPLTSFVKIYHQRFVDSADVELADQFIFTDTKTLFLFNIMGIVVFPMIFHLMFDIWVITLAVFCIVLIIPAFIWRSMNKKRMDLFEEQLPDAFALLSSSLQAGASLNMAIEEMVKQSQAPTNQEFGLLVKRLRLGVTLEDALVEMEKRTNAPSFTMASSAIRISREVGGNLRETIDSMSTTLRRKKVMEGKIDSLTSQGRAQGIFMSLLPVFLMVMLSFLEPEAMKKLYTTKGGFAVLMVMIIMEGFGYFFINKVTKIDA